MQASTLACILPALRWRPQWESFQLMFDIMIGFCFSSSCEFFLFIFIHLDGGNMCDCIAVTANPDTGDLKLSPGTEGRLWSWGTKAMWQARLWKEMGSWISLWRTWLSLIPEDLDSTLTPFSCKIGSLGERGRLLARLNCPCSDTFRSPSPSTLKTSCSRPNPNKEVVAEAEGREEGEERLANIEPRFSTLENRGGRRTLRMPSSSSRSGRETGRRKREGNRGISRRNKCTN